MDGAGKKLIVVVLAWLLSGCWTPNMQPYLQDFAVSQRPAEPGEVTVTFLGTSTLLFEDGSTRFMVDGFFSRPTAWEAYIRGIETNRERVRLALARATVDSLEALFVLQSHYDHALDAAYVAHRTGATVYGSASTMRILEGAESTLPPDHRQQYVLDAPYIIGDTVFTVQVIRSKHGPLPRVLDDIGETIDAPLSHPASAYAYKEGGTYDLLIRHARGTTYVTSSANYANVRPDISTVDALFLAVGGLGKQKACRRQAFYEETVVELNARVIIPVHWDNNFRQLSDDLRPAPRIMGSLKKGLGEVIQRAKEESRQVCLLQGYQRFVLFRDGACTSDE